jgi:hypothetical protein
MECCLAKDYRRPALVVQETHYLRATATAIKWLQKNGSDDVKLIPTPILAPGREDLPRVLQNCAMVIEAWKLWKYQCKGHIATREEIMSYVRLHQGAP